MIAELQTTGGKIRVGDGEIWSELKDTCPVCGNMDCFFTCAESRNSLSLDSVLNRQRWNAFIDGIESLILSLSCAGYIVTDQAFQDAVEAAIEAGGNEFGD